MKVASFIYGFIWLVSGLTAHAADIAHHSCQIILPMTSDPRVNQILNDALKTRGYAVVPADRYEISKSKEQLEPGAMIFSWYTISRWKDDFFHPRGTYDNAGFFLIEIQGKNAVPLSIFEMNLRADNYYPAMVERERLSDSLKIHAEVDLPRDYSTNSEFIKMFKHLAKEIPACAKNAKPPQDEASSEWESSQSAL